MRWRSDFSSLPIGTIARKLSAGGEPRIHGVALPAGTKELSVRARLRGAGVLAWVVVADARGRISLLPLGRVPKQTATLTTRVKQAGPLRVLGIQLALPESEAFMLAHDEAEGAVSVAPSGEVDVGPLVAGNRVLTDWHDWTLSTGGDVLRRANGATVRFSFPDTGLRLVFRPAQQTDGQVMPVVVSPDIASAAGGIGGTTVLDFQDTQIAARIVGVASRLPTVPADTRPVRAGRRAVALDRDRRERAGRGDAARGLDLGPTGRRSGRLSRPPFANLVVDSRVADERALAGDPLAHATAVALGAAGLVALLLAVLGLLGRRRQRAARREERLLRSRGAGAGAGGHAQAAAHARRDPARARLPRRAGAGGAALAPGGVADPRLGDDRRARAAAASSIPTGWWAGSALPR